MQFRDIFAEDLDLRDIVYLLAMIRGGGSEDLKFIRPLESFVTPLSPYHDWDREITRHLHSKRLLAVHTGSHLNAFIFDENEEPSRYYWAKSILADSDG